MKLYLKGNTLGFICLCVIVWSKKIMLDFLPWLGEQMDRIIRKNQKIFNCLVFFSLICAGIIIIIMPIYAGVFDGHDPSILSIFIPAGVGLTCIFIIALKDMIGSKQEKMFTDAMGDSKAVFEEAESEARVIYDKAIAEAELRARAVYAKADENKGK